MTEQEHQDNCCDKFEHCWHENVGVVERTLDAYFEKWGRFVSRNPGRVMILSVLWGLWGIGILQINTVVETSTENLYAPQNTLEWRNEQTYNRLFPSSSTGGGYGQVIVTDKTSRGSNVFTDRHLKEFQRLYDDINANVATPQGLKYPRLCARDLVNKTSCNDQSVLNFYFNNYRNASQLVSQRFYGVSSSFSSYAGDDIFMKSILGSPIQYSTAAVLNASNHTVNRTYPSQTPAFLIYFSLNGSISNGDASNDWEGAFIEYMTNTWDSPNIFDFSFETSRSFDDELNRTINSDITIFIVAIVILLVFSVTTLLRFEEGQCLCCSCCNYKVDWFREKSIVGTMGLVSAALSVATTFGMCLTFRVKFNAIVSITPFLMLGLGVDDMFVILRAYELTDPNTSVEERISHTMKTAGVSILYTSITDLAAFLAGTSSSFGSVRAFCVYAGIGVFMDFVFQVTFFMSALVYESRWKYSGQCSTCCNCTPYEDIPVTGKPMFEKTFMSKWGDVILNPIVKVVFLLAFAGYVAGAAIGLTRLEAYQNFVDLAPLDSHLGPFYRDSNEYFNHQGPTIEMVFVDQIDYHLQSTATTINTILTKNIYPQSCMISGSYYGWYPSYLEWRPQQNLQPFVSSSANSSVISEWYTTLRYQYLTSETGQGNQGEMVFSNNDNNNTLRISRSYLNVEMKPTGQGTRILAQCLPEMRTIQSQVNFGGMFLYQSNFVFAAADLQTIPQTIQNLILAAVCGFVVTLILIPHPIVSIFVMYTVSQILLGVLGYMALWNLRINTTTMISVVISIGFSVDNTAHIIHGYMIAPYNTRPERIRHSLEAVGLPVLLGDISTMLAMAPLGAAQSEIFVSFNKVIILVMVFGVAHGLIFLPIVLSCCGPNGHYGGPDEEDHVEMTARLDKESQPITSAEIQEKQGVKVVREGIVREI